MSNGCSGNIIYLSLIIVEFLLKIIYGVSNTFLVLLEIILRSFLNVNMTETAKKSKRNNDPSINQTVANRGLISANWQKFLAYNLIADKKIEKPLQENSKEHFTGTFRRARKKKTKTQASVRNDLKTLDIAKETNVIANNDDNLANKELKGPKKQDNSSKNRLTKFIAIDCEMVGIGYDGSDHMLARVSLVNKFGDCIYDKFVKPREEIIDYRTSVSGVRREDLINGEEFSKVQKDVAEMIRGKILVGHSLKHDLSVLFLSHPKRNIRDTSRYKPFRKITKGSTPSLKRLAKDILGIEIQHGEHSSVEDARAAMQLYCTVAKDWERMNTEKRGHCLSISADDGEEDPKFPFGSMPKGTFNMDDFKRCYSNEDLSISIPYFWQKFDPDHYSIWYAEYKYPEELAKVFMSCNLISDMMQRLYKMQKQAFASVCLFGDDNNSSISGVWVWRGRELAFPLSPHWQTHYETYQWTRLDPADPATKQLVQKYFSWSGTDRKWRKFNQGKIFK